MFLIHFLSIKSALFNEQIAKPLQSSDDRTIGGMLVPWYVVVKDFKYVTFNCKFDDDAPINKHFLSFMVLKPHLSLQNMHSKN